RDGHSIANITTFGQPKVTDRAGSLVLQKRLPIHRFIAGDDPVTTYPGEPFAHCGDGVMLLDGPHLVRLDFGSEPFRLFDQLVVPVNEASLKMHGTYLERVTTKSNGALVEIPFSDRGCYLSGP
ncbi:MAG TPA: hypothetical protein VMV81_04615, partial [Phycisphaerae bacterium]|nr:hypothetical protein [Phycisphaerae bacterium]